MALALASDSMLPISAKRTMYWSEVRVNRMCEKSGKVTASSDARRSRLMRCCSGPISYSWPANV
jgi:hypothetical protein